MPDGLDGAEVEANGAAIGTIGMAIPSPLPGGRMPAMAATGTAVSACGAARSVVNLPVHDPERKRASIARRRAGMA